MKKIILLLLVAFSLASCHKAKHTRSTAITCDVLQETNYNGICDTVVKYSGIIQYSTLTSQQLEDSLNNSMQVNNLWYDCY